MLKKLTTQIFPKMCLNTAWITANIKVVEPPASYTAKCSFILSIIPQHYVSVYEM